jgi:hypothetical protein
LAYRVEVDTAKNARGVVDDRVDVGVGRGSLRPRIAPEDKVDLRARQLLTTAVGDRRAGRGIRIRKLDVDDCARPRRTRQNHRLKSGTGR